MEHEVWITLRFKGEMSAALDSRAQAEHLLAQLTDHIRENGSLAGFTICQPGDVLEVENEAEIYQCP